MNPNQYPQGQHPPPQYYQQSQQPQGYNHGYPVGRYPPVAYPQGDQPPQQMPGYPGMPGPGPTGSGPAGGGYPQIHIKQEPHWGVEGGQQQSQQQMHQAAQQRHYLQQQQQMQYHQQIASNEAYIQQQHQIQQQQQMQQQMAQQQHQQMHQQPAQQQSQPQQPVQQQSLDPSDLQQQMKYGHFPHSVSSTHSFSSLKVANQQDNRDASSSSAAIVPQPKIFSVNLAEENLSIGELCLLGREIVADITYRTSHLTSILKKVMERKPLVTGENPQFLAEQCKEHLEKLVEIRLMIEKNRQKDWKRMSGEEYIAMVMDDSEKDETNEYKITDDLKERIRIKDRENAPQDGMIWYEGRWIPESLWKKYQTFEENKAKIMELSNELKSLGWQIDVSNPAHLKRPEKTKWTKKDD
ncbi:unnamed protein product [Caenorhabditis angaria]|uniref:Uncharacterized protein n=1 Tax=Caenorhabditis angaria TaxID=860376 RepID=A0A9P1MZE1_9PELO|nr:unnamed protein product [Caenorhabditis angaria]